MNGPSHQHSSTHNKSNNHLRRSNAIRIRSRSRHILSRNSNCLIVQQVANKNEDHLTIFDQLKHGVRLHSIRDSPKIEELSRKSSQQIKRAPSSDKDGENLASILARVLEKRNLVMQLTDEESELSSIDSQPEEQYEMLEESYNNVEIVSSVPKSSSNVAENLSGCPYDNIGCFGGRIDLIMRL